MNKHIELVKKWRANPKSVTQAELKANCAAAFDACDAHDATDVDFEAYDAAYDACDYDAANSISWVRCYDKVTK